MFTSKTQTQPILNQIKVDFEEMKKRVKLVQTLRAMGYSQAEILAEVEHAKQQDIVDSFIFGN